MISQQMQQRKKQIPAAGWLALATGFLLMLYAPLETYFTNKKEFWFDFYGIIGALSFAFCVLTVSIFAVLFLLRRIRENLYRVAYAAGSILFFDFWIEGTFLMGYLPMLDGREIDWSRYAGHRVWSIGVLVLLTAVTVVLIRKFGFLRYEGYVKNAILLLSATLLVTLLSLAVMNQGFEKKERLLINKDHEWEYSNDQNFVILILDAVDGDTFNEVLKEHPEYTDWLKDFTYYENMVSTYTQTAYSVGYIMTEKWFEDDKEDYETYLTRGYNESPFLNRLEEQGYRVGMYITEFVPANSDRVYTFDNMLKTKAIDVDFWNFLKIEAKMVGFRYAPFDLKRFCPVYTRDFMFSRKNIEQDNLYYDLNEDFYADLLTKQIEYTDDKMFKLYHIEGAHVPFRHDADVRVITDGTYEMSIEASFQIAHTYIQKLQEAGVYDNTALVIMSDHGFSKEDIPEDRLHPVFFVKGVGERGETMQISEAPVSFEDFGTAFERLLAGADGRKIFDQKEGDIRERRCYFLSYPELMRNIECIQRGHAGDLSQLEILEKDKQGDKKTTKQEAQ